MASLYPLEQTESAARYARLMRQGQVAQANGQMQRAHRFWREAAMINPVSEQVWLALLSVVETEADRQTCLQNIVAINPNNLSARQQLDSYLDDTQPSAPVTVTALEDHPVHFFDVIVPAVRVLEAVLIGMLLAIFIMLLPYVQLSSA